MDLTIHQVQVIETNILKEIVRICDENEITYYGAYGTVLGAIRHGGSIPWDDDVDIYVPENELERFLEAMGRDLDEKYWVDFRTPGTKYRDFPRVGYKGYDTEIIHVDVFRLAGAPSDEKQQKKLRWISGSIHLMNNVKRKGVKSYSENKEKKKKAIIVSIIFSIIPLKISVKLIDYYTKKYSFNTADYVGSSVSKSIRSIIPKEYIGRGVIVPYEDFQIRVPKEYDQYLTHMYGDYESLPPEGKRIIAMNRVYKTMVDPRTGLIHVQ